ncbi:MAG: hypothetical protein M1828_005534 [Chrysothrix sp. TS-e1954]|nr:MAG: hypothetical protein M1828_005534 [Chrysothrix sp. TS-e1954]
MRPRVQLLLLALVCSVHASSGSNASSPVNETICNEKHYAYQELAGYGFIPSNTTDSAGDTIGGIGSAVAFDRSSWHKTSTGYSGVIYAQPDRGWNTEGTLNYQSRVHKFTITLTPRPNATVDDPAAPNIHLSYLDTVFFFAPDGKATTGLDGNPSGHLSFPNFPDLPPGTYTGNGFGGPGPGDTRLVHDTEGLVLNEDGTFWVSDEYGPYIYHIDQTGHVIQAIRPPDAIIPRRNGSESFSADSPPEYATGESDDVTPADPDTGRVNNHGLEGLTKSPDGRYLYAMMQGALQQEGGQKSSTERYVRLLQYDTSASQPEFVAEYVVPLPFYRTAGNKDKTALSSEIHYISPTQFLFLARDSNAGRGQSSSTSLFRHADVFDISTATNIKGATYDCATCNIASSGAVLNAAIEEATTCYFVDFNVNSQLNRFGVHNGGAQDAGLLNEKWESLALVPVDGGTGENGEYFLFSFSDNDFITQDGHLNHGTFSYKDSSGFNLDNQVLAFQISLPPGANPS